MRLPAGWVSAPLLEITDLHDSQRIPLNRDQRAAMPGDYAYYGANGQVDTVGQYLFEGDHILIAEDGGFFDQPGRDVAYRVSGRFWVNNHAHILSTANGVLQGYLTRILNTLDWMRVVSGTTRLKLTQAGMQRIQVTLPPTAEQRRIVAKLDTLTACLARARTELERVPSLADSIRKIATRQLWATSGFGRLERLIAAPIRNGLSINGSDQPPGMPSLKLSALRGDTVNLGEIRYLPISEDQARPYSLATGDMLVSRGNGTRSLVGKASLVSADPGVNLPIFPDTAFRIRPDTERVSPRWLTYVWNSPEMRTQIEAAARTTAGIWKIAQRDLLMFRLPQASLNEQRRQLAILDKFFARAAHLEAEAARARALLDRLEAALLAKAFRGELVPQDPNDEPASVLLDRIRARRAAAPKPKRGRRVAAAEA